MDIPEPTLGEVVRTLERIETDVARRLDELGDRLDRVITLDLYDPHRAALADRITALASDVEELRHDKAVAEERRLADRRVIVAAAVAAALSLLVSVLGAVVITALGIN